MSYGLQAVKVLIDVLSSLLYNNHGYWKCQVPVWGNMPQDNGKKSGELINFGEPVDMLTARVPVRLKKWLADLAQKERRSVSQQLTVVLEEAKKSSEESGVPVLFNGESGWRIENPRKDQDEKPGEIWNKNRT